MKLRHAVMIAAALTIPLAACSDDSGGGGRPSAAELEEVMSEEGGLESDDGGEIDKMVACIAEGMVDSDIPDDVLRAMVEGDEDAVSDDEMADSEATVEKITTDCAAEAMGG